MKDLAGRNGEDAWLAEFLTTADSAYGQLIISRSSFGLSCFFWKIDPNI